MEDYIIVYGKNTTQLAEAVNQFLRLGYVLIGGVSCQFEFREYYQAMAKPKQL